MKETMLNIIIKATKTFNRINIMVMNNKMSVFILIAFLSIASSCKSEVKSTKSSTTNIDNQEIGVDNGDATDSGQEVESPTEETEAEVKEVKKPAETTSPPEVKQPSTQKKKSPKPIVDRGIEIEMGMEETKEEEKVIKQAKDEIKVKGEAEVMKDEKPSKPERTETFIGFPKHTLFDDLLKAHVTSSGVVDYSGLKSKESKLDEYLSILESHPPETTWNRDQELAFWINAYNAYTIKLILKNYPVSSITDLHGGKPWDVKWINLDGRSLSLNNIENDIIRPKYNEPRIHFAVNCAAKSCPPILNGAYKAKSLDAQLESQTKKFINNTSYNTLGKNAIEVSKIFEWYGEDFGDVASFVLRYADTIIKPSAKVTFKEYDWSLNGK